MSNAEVVVMLTIGLVAVILSFGRRGPIRPELNQRATPLKFKSREQSTGGSDGSKN